MTVDGINEISWWIMGYGDKAQVLEPVELVDLISDRVNRMAKIYRTKKKSKSRSN